MVRFCAILLTGFHHLSIVLRSIDAVSTFSREREIEISGADSEQADRE